MQVKTPQTAEYYQNVSKALESGIKTYNTTVRCKSSMCEVDYWPCQISPLVEDSFTNNENEAKLRRNQHYSYWQYIGGCDSHYLNYMHYTEDWHRPHHSEKIRRYMIYNQPNLAYNTVTTCMMLQLDKQT